MLSAQIKHELRAIVGERHALTDPADLATYAYDATHYTHTPDAVVVPASTDEVSAVLRLASRERLPVVARGSGTSLCGGATPIRGGVVLSTARLRRILDINAARSCATAEPGVNTAEFMRAVETRGLFYPPDPSSQSVSTLGGNVAQGAGGPRGAKYGSLRDYVLGCDVILADGSRLRTGANTVKNASGYDLTRLFVGSRGTLCFFSQLRLRLLPLPVARRLLLLPCADLAAAARLALAITAAGLLPNRLEALNDQAAAAAGAGQTSAILLCELDGSAPGVDRQAAIVARLAGAQSGEDRAGEAAEAIWNQLQGWPTLARVQVPRDRLPALLAKVGELGGTLRGDWGVVAGAGTGGVRLVALPGTKDAGTEPEGSAPAAEFAALAGEFGLVRPAAEPAERLRRSLKSAFDPRGILNPLVPLAPDGSQAR